MFRIFHSDRFVPQLPEGHRFPIDKYRLIREQLLYEGSIEEDGWIDLTAMGLASIAGLNTYSRPSELKRYPYAKP